jgi:amphiphysin
MMDARIVRPASDCREHIKPIKKVIKKRDDKRLDFERYQDRVQSIQKKTKKADNDEVKLARAQEDLARAQDVRKSYLSNTITY